MYTIVITIREWTDPETGATHAPGKVTIVPADRIARPDTYDSENAFRFPAPWEQYEPGQDAPVDQPPSPFGAANVDAPLPVPATVHRSAKADAPAPHSPKNIATGDA